MGRPFGSPIQNETLRIFIEYKNKSKLKLSISIYNNFCDNIHLDPAVPLPRSHCTILMDPAALTNEVHITAHFQRKEMTH